MLPWLKSLKVKLRLFTKTTDLERGKDEVPVKVAVGVGDLPQSKEDKCTSRLPIKDYVTTITPEISEISKSDTCHNPILEQILSEEDKVFFSSGEISTTEYKIPQFPDENVVRVDRNTLKEIKSPRILKIKQESLESENTFLIAKHLQIPNYSRNPEQTIKNVRKSLNYCIFLF